MDLCPCHWSTAGTWLGNGIAVLGDAAVRPTCQPLVEGVLPAYLFFYEAARLISVGRPPQWCRSI